MRQQKHIDDQHPIIQRAHSLLTCDSEPESIATDELSSFSSNTFIYSKTIAIAREQRRNSCEYMEGNGDDGDDTEPLREIHDSLERFREQLNADERRQSRRRRLDGVDNDATLALLGEFLPV